MMFCFTILPANRMDLELAVALIKAKNSTEATLTQLCSVLAANAITDELLTSRISNSCLQSLLPWANDLQVTQDCVFLWLIHSVGKEHNDFSLVQFMYNEMNWDVSTEIEGVCIEMLRDCNEQFKQMACLEVAMQGAQSKFPLNTLNKEKLQRLLKFLVTLRFTATDPIRASLALLTL